MPILYRVLAVMLMVCIGTVGQAACRADRLALRGDWGTADFSVELALTAQDRGRGLMFRETLPATSGMLFIFDPPRRVGFWMRNTLIPLDMIFADRHGVVQRVHVNAIPGDETTIDGGPGIYAVLEINGGMSRDLGIQAGTQMQHQLFGQQAAWPCP